MSPSDTPAITKANKVDLQSIVEGINAYNLNEVTALGAVCTPLEFVVKDGNGVRIGGILGGIGYWNGLEIKLLWIAASYRNQGYGTRLLQHMEQMAKAKGATVSMLDTFDFQAEGFYLKNGYHAIGEIKDFPKGHR